jgi:hypothetical protein
MVEICFTKWDIGADGVFDDEVSLGCMSCKKILTSE